MFILSISFGIQAYKKIYRDKYKDSKPVMAVNLVYLLV